MGRASRQPATLRGSTRVFGALADETRQTLLARLGEAGPLSIARLSEGAAITRQGITKHLRVLRSAGLVRGVRQGRETRFELDPRPLHRAVRELSAISRQWDGALVRLKALVEEQRRPAAPVLP